MSCSSLSEKQDKQDISSAIHDEKQTAIAPSAAPQTLRLSIIVALTLYAVTMSYLFLPEPVVAAAGAAAAGAAAAV